MFTVNGTHPFISGSRNDLIHDSGTAGLYWRTSDTRNINGVSSPIYWSTTKSQNTSELDNTTKGSETSKGKSQLRINAKTPDTTKPKPSNLQKEPYTTVTEVLQGRDDKVP